MAGQDVEWDEVQGIVLSAYWPKEYSRYFLLTIENADNTRAWLADLLNRTRETNRQVGRGLSFGDDRTETGFSINIAFAKSGLEKLGLPQAAMKTFPWDFRDTMTSPLRRRILADRGSNDPRHWEWGGDAGEPDILVILYARERELAGLSDDLKASWRGALREFERLDRYHDCMTHGRAPEELRKCPRVGYRPENMREHFGFTDGLSQPAIETSPRSRKFLERGEINSIIRSGEFILGYVNERGQLPVSPSVAVPRTPGSRLGTITRSDHSMSGHPPFTKFPRLDFGRNGTFLVYRQLGQDVLAFDRLIRRAVAELGEDRTPRLNDEADAREWLAAKFIGRWPDGTPLALEPRKPPPEGGNLRAVNNFGYAEEDAHGLRCPLGAHIRRGNPRDTLEKDVKWAIRRNNQHRLLRRGRLYGEQTNWTAWDDGERTGGDVRRGLHFVAINACLESQFEFVQQSWMNTPFFNGLTDEFDPLLAMPETQGAARHFTVQGAPVNRRITLTEELVKVRGGAYFFLPGKAALEFLANERWIDEIQYDDAA